MNNIKLIKVKIIKASMPTFWYADKVGTEFDVYDGVYQKSYIVKEDYDRHSDPRRRIDKEDCKIISLEDIEKERDALQKKLDEIKKYLDDCIVYWRGRRDNLLDTEGKEMAMYYVDAFQSARVSIFGELLPE